MSIMYFIGVSFEGIRVCTDDDDRGSARSTPVPILHVRRPMDEKRSEVDRLGGIEGVDAAALGIDATPNEAPPGAPLEDDVRTVPGPDVDVPRDEAKPWFTSLAATSEQAGVANDPPDAQDERFPWHEDDEEPR
jgi:hypothetical protein